MNKDEYIEYLKRVLSRRTKIAEERGKLLGIEAYKFGALKTLTK
jgi:hypothetical protein